MRPFLALLLFALPVFAQQQQEPQPVHVEAPVHVTAIDIVADVRDSAGKLPPALTPDDFILVEDGVERKVIGVDYLRAERLAAAAQPAEGAAAAPPAQKPWQTVLYFETDLSNGRGRKQTVKELSKHVDRLVQMGTVDVVFANPRPKALLRNSRDAEAVRAALKTVETSGGANQLAMHRLEFLTHVQTTSQLEAAKETDVRYVMDANGQVKKEKPVQQPRSNFSANATAVDVRVVKPYIEQEIQLISRFRRNLVSYLSNYNRYAPRTLIMVTDGYDLDPLEYYSAYLNKNDDMELRSYVTQAALGDSAAQLARSLATAGWMTVSVQGDAFSDRWIDDASSMTSMGRVHQFSLAQPQTGARAILFRPADPLKKVAEETGGDVVGNSGKIAQAIDRIDDRLRITYQVDRQPDGKARTIELRARDPKLKVRATRWAASSTPDEMAEQRALAQLHGGTFTGDLPVQATVEWTANPERRQGSLHVVAKPAGGLAKGDFRFTLAILVPPEQAFVTNKPLPGFRLNGGVFDLRTPLDLPAKTSVVVIAIEDVATGMWGSSRIEIP
jgi:hypothetical protein